MLTGLLPRPYHCRKHPAKPHVIPPPHSVNSKYFV
jgi:hypothetical protein